MSFTVLTREILFLSIDHKIHIFELKCNFLFIIQAKTQDPRSFGSFVKKLNRARREMTSSISSIVKI